MAWHKYLWVLTTALFFYINILFGIILLFATIVLFIQDGEIEYLKKEVKKNE